jgi:uncharacterized alkaline shock family protein YloU
MSDQAKEARRAPGLTTIAPGVLVRIAQLTAISVPGVSGLAAAPASVDRLFRRGNGEGVQIEIEDNQMSAELYLALDHGADARKVGHEVQQAVARAIEQMVGMEVGRIDVHIEEIDFEQGEG